MNVKENKKKIRPSNAAQIAPLLPSAFSAKNGLDCLRMIDSLYITHSPSLREVILGFPSEAKFDICNGKNVRILTALESSTFWQRFLCTNSRRFTLRIIDYNNQDIILIKREFKCCSGCCWCANAQCSSQELTVESPPGTAIGTVSQIGSCCRSIFAIKDENENHVLTLRGPMVVCDSPLSCNCKSKFTLIGTDGVTEIGTIYKKYQDVLKESMASVDSFVLKVPVDLDVKMKAMSLGALFLIDYLIFSAVPNSD